MKYWALLAFWLAAATVRAVEPPGALDPSFDAGALGATLAIAIQPDNKILIGGSFAAINGTPRGHIARLDSSGALDPSFNPGFGADDFINSVAVQGDGSILLGGNFINFNGKPCNGIVRLLSNGSLDPSFNPGAGASDQVTALALQPDGKIVLGGYFTRFAGVEANYVARLNSNGSLDASFAPGDAAGDNVLALAIQTDRKILAAGYFFRNQRVYSLARFHENGAWDDTFSADPSLAVVRSFCLQSDGKILTAGLGNYNSQSGVMENIVVRLNANGSLDPSFNGGTNYDDSVNCIAVQSNGRIIIGGNFTHAGSAERQHIARLNSNGSLDASFNPGTLFNEWIGALAILQNGRILAGGGSTKSLGAARDSIARLIGDAPLQADQLRLSIGRIPGGKTVVSWPAAASYFVLETCDALGKTNVWRTAPGAAVAGATLCQWTNQAAAGRAFYRLRQP